MSTRHINDCTPVEQDANLGPPHRRWRTSLARHAVVGALAVCSIGCVLSSTSFAADEAKTSKTIQVPQNLQEILQMQGSARVIVRLKADFEPEGTLTPVEIEKQRAKIAHVQEQFLNGLKDSSFQSLQERKFATVPYVTIYVNEAVLQYIVQNPLVTSVEADIPVPATAN